MDKKWVRRFIQLAEEVATWSKDPDRHVGALIVKDRHVVATGYNGPPRGVNDTYGISTERKLMRTIHAELNAILEAKMDLAGCVIFCTTMPCASCMAVIIQSGITDVHVLREPEHPKSTWAASWEEAKKMALEAGVAIWLE